MLDVLEFAVDDAFSVLELTLDTSEGTCPGTLASLCPHPPSSETQSVTAIVIMSFRFM